MGKNIERILKSKRNQKAYNDANEDLSKLLKPKVCWKRFKINGFTEEKIILENGIKIGGGPVVSIIKGAHELICAVITIGQELECLVKKYMKDSEMFKGIILDGLSSWAVDLLRKEFVKWIKMEMHTKNGWKTSAMVSCGENSWSVKEQRIIFDLLKKETEEIGVKLKDSMMMLPLKSISLIIGTGPDPLGREEPLNCSICEMRDRCRYRKTRQV